MKKIFKKTGITLNNATKYVIQKIKKINFQYLVPKSRKIKESDKQHGFTFKNEKKKGPRF
jgi:hypothetical protein